jgi:tetratricopeptide (TPR) repeat protein
MASVVFTRILKYFFILTAVAALSACSNTKDGFVNRTFHDLSAHYNGYYNAGLKLEEAKEKLAVSHVDHYDRILSVFQYADAAKSKAIYPLLEDAMKRTSTVISRHTIIDKRGNEKPDSEKWIDDNWVYYGQAQFFKHDYFEAIETFKYVESTYKKEPGRHLGTMWIAKTYIQLTQMREAEEKLDYLRNQSDFPKKHRWELEAVYADYYLQTMNFEKATTHLTRAAALVKDREKKIRYHFILAQLHQQKNEFKQAFDLYTKVIKMNPKYEMAFNARLNRARCYDSSSGSSENVLNELLKMEKDPKNKDFLDQIYFALAGLSKNEGKQDKEIEYLNKSIRSSVNNKNQKALSYLELAKIEYAIPDYRTAQAYYDSTISNLANDFPGYTEILNRRNSLTKLVKFLRTIEMEDSLQGLSKLTPEERARIVDDVIAKEEREKELAKTQEQSNQIFDLKSRDASAFNQASGSNWYFYNTQALSFGFNEFTKKFGDRPLEDNWRRSKKEASGMVEDIEKPDITTEPEGIDTTGTADAGVRRENMIRSIPADVASLEKSTNKIVDAYYNVGMIYREQLNDLRASAETFEELLRRFPDNKYMLQSYYQLYRTYSVLGNSSKAEYYKNIILTNHGDTEYAEIIRNPNYATDKANRKSNLELFYEETYRKYLNGEYAAVIARKTESEIQFPENNLAPKFALLKSLAIGKTQALPAFEASLNDVIRNYSTDSVKDAAQEILDYIQNRGETPEPPPDLTMPASDTSTAVADAHLYKYLPDTVHHVILITQNIGGLLNTERLKNKLSDFNMNNYASKNISMQDLMFDHRNKIFIMKFFNDKVDALEYVNALYDNDDVFGQVSADAYQLYVISVNNLPILLNEKHTADYEDFYRSFYR